MVLEAVRTLATAPELEDWELESIAREFGNSWPIHGLSIPVGVLLRARKEYESLNTPGAATTSCARIVAVAEALVDVEPGDTDFQAKFLALSREIDNLRGYTKR
jgi:hypothetical protein